jgi:hypothetical protein
MKDEDYLIVVPCCEITLYVDPTARREVTSLAKDW